jgi:serine/threonine protein kinase
VLYKKILECKIDFPFEISPSCKDMIKRLLCINPDKRIKIDQIKQHSFYQIGLKQLKKTEFIIDHRSISNKVLEKLVKLGYKASEIKSTLKNNENNSISTSYNLLYNKVKTVTFKNSLSKNTESKSL